MKTSKLFRATNRSKKLNTLKEESKVKKIVYVFMVTILVFGMSHAGVAYGQMATEGDYTMVDRNDVSAGESDNTMVESGVSAGAVDYTPEEVMTCGRTEDYNLAADQRFHNIDGDSFVDRHTCTVWQAQWPDVNTGSVMTYIEAESFCASLVAGGFTDWSLPTITELDYLIDNSNSPDLPDYFPPVENGFCDPLLPSDLQHCNVWSNTPGFSPGQNRYFADFLGGAIGEKNESAAQAIAVCNRQLPPGPLPGYYTVSLPLNTVDMLAQRVAALEAILERFEVSEDGNDIYIVDANLHIESGSGATNGTVNGRGNLIIGYNELRGSGNDRSGSHNLILGAYNNYRAYGGIVAGKENDIAGGYSSITGGYQNTASGGLSSVSGGRANTASGPYGSVSGGYNNKASYRYTSVSGGNGNVASGKFSSVSGGVSRTESRAYYWRGGAYSAQ